MIKVMCIFGTRPEAIKMAPLIQRLQQERKIQTISAVTAQHREMLDQVLSLFSIKPDYDLNIMKPEQTLTEITITVLQRLDNIIQHEKPDMVLVHGDTNTTFAASLAAYYHKVPIGHVEAGLRTYDKYAPYPEEMNRKLTGCLADLHFTPTFTAKKALLKEGVPADRIIVTGNTVIDALLQVVRDNYFFKQNTLNQLDFDHQKIVLVTTHRRENLGEPMVNIFHALKNIVETYLEVVVVLPVHLNPQVRRSAQQILGGLDRVKLIAPLDYADFANLMARCYLVLTDSGGLQEEAPALGRPVLVFRERTERPEAVMAGTVKLVGTDRLRIIQATSDLLTDEAKYSRMATAVNPYGDGKAADRIVQALRYFFRLTEQPADEYRSEL